MVRCRCIFVNVNFETTRDRVNFVVKDIIAVILGTDMCEEFAEHWNKESKVLWEVVEVALDSDV